MKYLHLIWAALFRRKLRTVFTLLSVLIAFLLFGLLDAVRITFVNFGYSNEGYTRLVTMSKNNMGSPLPRSLSQRIKQVPGVLGADYGFNFFGAYQDPKNGVAIETHTDNFYDFYPETELVPSDARAVLAKTRTGAIAGESLAKKYNWKVGDKIPLQTSLARKDGSTTWTFDLVGIYRYSEPNMKVWETLLHVNDKYVDEARAADQGTTTWHVVKVASPSDVEPVAQAVDALSANSDHETKTQSENAFSAALLSQLGDVGLIVTSIMGAVFFTLLLLTGHTMTQAVNERVPEIGVLKTIGFSGRSVMSLVLSESLLLLVLGGAGGLAIASLAIQVMRWLGTAMPGVFLPIPLQPVGGSVWLRGLSVAVGVGIVVGTLPALRGLRLRIVDALSGR